MMDELPDHLLCLIFSQLRQRVEDLNAISQVSRRFYDLERHHRHALKVGCGLHPFESALSSLCTRFPYLSKIEIVYAGWMSKLGKQLDDNGLRIVATLCPELTDMTLSFCTFITDAGLGYIANCKKLQAVNLNFVPRITGNGLLSLVTGCKSISVLHLSLCLNVNSAEWLHSLGQLEKIEDLAICQCKGIGEGDLAKLGYAWSKLRKFQFQVVANHRYMKGCGHTARNGWDVQGFKCDALKELDLINCMINPNRGLGCILSSCNSLVSLRLDMCLGLRDRDLISLAMNSTGLKVLSLRCQSNFSLSEPSNYAPQLTDEVLKAFTNYCQGLEEVLISISDGCYPFVPCFSLSGILAVVEGCLHLRVLVLDNIYAFDDQGMEAVSVAHSLDTLELNQCQGVTDEGLQLLSDSHSLKHLKLLKCLGISDAGVAALNGFDKVETLIGFQRLETLRVQDCPRISEKAVQGIAKTVSYRCDLSWLC